MPIELTLSMRTFCPFLAALALLMSASAEDRPPAEQHGWTLAVHSYTFQIFPVFEAIDKTAAVGAKQMSISGSVNLPNADGKFVKVSTIGLSDKDPKKWGKSSPEIVQCVEWFNATCTELVAKSK
jgi:hypothetical protein